MQRCIADPQIGDRLAAKTTTGETDAPLRAATYNVLCANCSTSYPWAKRRAALVAAFDEADILVRGYPVDGVRITIADAANNDRVLAVLAAHPELRR